MMLSMFVVWIIVFVGVFRHWRITPVLAVANLAWTIVLLTMHMTDPIPLNF